jgi:hypothetical protein
MFLSAVEFRALYGLQGPALSRTHSSARTGSGGFSIADKLRAEPQPLFPGNVETSSDPTSSGLGSERPRSRGYSKFYR